ncbi:hypothetical protein BD289DRAFT_114932 [Coniella lustricola]|uniref:Uncharacterized protein n=1 Tax=Coniella lustricola TaxID=2025994 RepID=A0A2T2ZX47_9PEZI|nr:hypothetical protein BD289DRAFT_114932 [Coniella lustricola]
MMHKYDEPNPTVPASGVIKGQKTVGMSPTEWQAKEEEKRNGAERNKNPARQVSSKTKRPPALISGQHWLFDSSSLPTAVDIESDQFPARTCADGSWWRKSNITTVVLLAWSVPDQLACLCFPSTQARSRLLDHCQSMVWLRQVSCSSYQDPLLGPRQPV